MNSFQKFAVALLICCGLCVAAANHARAQGGFVQWEPVEKRPSPTVAEKIDEFGDLRWCDLTARLDNLAANLQNEPKARAFIIGYHEKGKPGYSENRLKGLRRYLVVERGIESEKLVFVNGGNPISERALAELWLVPEGAPPPVPEPSPAKPAPFSGMLGSYRTDETFQGLYVEVGYSETDLVQMDFVEKLKEQPESVGYFVIRAAKESLPGTFGRIARRDERELQKRYGIAAERLKSIDGGMTEGENSEVELWILPEDAPPPPGVAEKLERVIREGFALDVHNLFDYEDDDEQTQWVIGNLAELLRHDPDARGVIIVRRYEPEEETPEGEGVATSDVAAGQDANSSGVGSVEEKEPDPLAVTERWKRVLTGKYGIEAHRLFVMFGKPSVSGAPEIVTWVTPKNAPLPDPFSVTNEMDVETLEEEDPADPTNDVVEEAPPPASTKF